MTSSIAKELLVCYVAPREGLHDIDLFDPGVARQLTVKEVVVRRRVKLDVARDMHTFTPTQLMEVQDKRDAKRRRRLAAAQSAPAPARATLIPLPAEYAAPPDGLAHQQWYFPAGHWATRFLLQRL